MVLCELCLPLPVLTVVFLTEELDHASWVDKVLVTLLLLLRDWLMAIPLHLLAQDPSFHATIRTVFEVGWPGVVGKVHGQP